MASIYNLTDTWNAGATVFDAFKMNVTDTASAAASRLWNYQIAGTTKGRLRKDGELGILSLGFAAADADVPDAWLRRVGANHLGINSLATATALSVFALTDAPYTNFESFRIDVGSTPYLIGTAKGGTGATRAWRIMVGNSPCWGFDTSGNFYATTDNTFDIGTSGALRPHNIYLANSLVAGGVVQAAGNITGAGFFGTAGNVVLASGAAAGQVILRPNGDTTSQVLFGLASISAGAQRITCLGLTSADVAALVTTNAALTNAAGAGAGTLTNAPTAGNPTKWIQINDNGTTRKIPTWT